MIPNGLQVWIIVIDCLTWFAIPAVMATILSPRDPLRRRCGRSLPSHDREVEAEESEDYYESLRTHADVRLRYTYTPKLRPKEPVTAGPLRPKTDEERIQALVLPAWATPPPGTRNQKP